MMLPTVILFINIYANTKIFYTFSNHSCLQIYKRGKIPKTLDKNRTLENRRLDI